MMDAGGDAKSAIIAPPKNSTRRRGKDMRMPSLPKRCIIGLIAILFLPLAALPSEPAEIESLRGITSVWAYIKDDTGGLIEPGALLGKLRPRLREQGLHLGGVAADAQLQIRISSIVVGNQNGRFLYVFVVHVEVLQLATLFRWQANANNAPRLMSTWSKTLFSFRIGDEATRQAIEQASNTLLGQLLADHAQANSSVR
jgi:hypothetical protein